MPAPSQSGNLVIDRTPRPDYERLRSALQEAQTAAPPSQLQAEALAELRAYRAQVSSPINPDTQRPPNPQDRASISGLGEVLITLAPDSSDASAEPVPIRLGADLVSVAIALSDELQINELDAALLLFDARTQASHRPDHDVVAAAKQVAALRRRETVLYLQEIARAALLVPKDNHTQNDDDFLSALLHERDTLVVEHNLVLNIMKRLSAGFKAEQAQASMPNRMSLHSGEAALLAELLFLLAYTVQFSSMEALMLRDLLRDAENQIPALQGAERVPGRPVSASPGHSTSASDVKCMSGFVPYPPENMSPQFVEAESVRNLLLLSWSCALDRSRYQDVYDPRTGLLGVNVLLKDDNFIPRTNNTPKLTENEDDKVQHMPRSLAAAELCSALFRFAVANPNEEDVLTTALRVCAFGGALTFLSEDLPSWIGHGAGSLSPDADLYADVLEDLALDVSEAPNLSVSLIQFTQNDVLAAASDAAYASFEGLPSGTPGGPRSAQPPASGRRLSISGSPIPSTPGVRPPTPGLRGRPPKPPGPRGSSRVSGDDIGSNFTTPTGANSTKLGSSQATEDKLAGIQKTSQLNGTSLVGSLAKFVARAVALAPSKLAVDSIGGGIRYWYGIGTSNAGLIPRIGDAVLDLWDASMRNPYAPGGVGTVFLDALKGFLLLLASTSCKQVSPTHAAASLRYLCEAGHPVVSLERASKALSYFHDLLSAPSTPHGATLSEAEVDALRGIISIIANAAEALYRHGGVTPVLGDLGNDLSIRIASLAIHDVTLSLKSSLLHALSALDDHRAISLFLENVSSDKATPLRRLIRGSEAETGCYDVTIRVLELVTACMSWPDDEYPEAAVESITTWFATEEILAYWSRRKYSFEAQRWHVVRLAAALISKAVHKNPTSERSFRIIARLLTPAPGTGAASYALRALVCASGLMRTADDTGGLTSAGARSLSNREETSWTSLYHISGRDSLIHAAEHGLGVAYREMQEAATTCAQVISLILCVPSGRLSIPGVVVAPASELLLGEVKAISAAASLVFAVNGFVPSLFRAGYNPYVCTAVLGMLSKATQESTLIAGILARDPPGTTGIAALFRASLADIVSRYREDEGNIDGKEDPAIAHQSESKVQDPPVMHSVLRIVESSLGVDGGSQAGMFLLGLKLDATGHYSSADYGVLGALVELVAGSHDSSGRIDSKGRATAATFLERLAANTVQKTSVAVLEHIRDVGGDPSVRGGGFADEMLFRILEATGNGDSLYMSSEVDWASLGELLAACMSLSALQVRLFPDYEVKRCISATGAEFGVDQDSRNVAHTDAGFASLPPSPLDLLRLLSSIASCDNAQIAFEALHKWHHLLVARIGVHDCNSGYSSIPLLFELCNALLGALAGPDKGNDVNALVKKDGGEVASTAILLCIRRMKECDNPHELGSEQSIGESRCTTLLAGVVRALAGVTGVGADASRARTSLYAALLICGKLADGRVPVDTMTRAFGGRLGPRMLSGTEALISAACTDAVSGPTAATKAAAMAAASMTTVLDPVRAMSALGAQNRLRRVVSAALADPEARKLISQACTRTSNSTDGSSGEFAAERAAIVVAEAALALIHAVSLAGHGARIIADAGCIESAAAMLTALESPSLLYYRSGDSYNSQDQRSSQPEGSLVPYEGASAPGTDDVLDLNVKGEREKRIALIGVVTGAIAAAVTCAETAVVEGALVALDQGKGVFGDLLRTMRSSRTDDLSAVSALGMIISRIPYEMLTAAASPTQLRMSLAAVIGVIIPATSKYHQLGSSGSLISSGISATRPENPREARRMRIMHPEGGSLFERDVVLARVICIQNVFAALRCPSGLLSLFIPKLSDKRGGMDENARLNDSDGVQNGNQPVGQLSEVLRICRVVLNEAQRSAEESMQIDARLAGENIASVSSRRLGEMEEYCQEEFGVPAEQLGGSVALDCLRKASSMSRRHADNCLSVFESSLFILREYVRTARESVRGQPSYSRGVEENNRHGGNEGAWQFSTSRGIAEAERLLEDAKNVLLPVCKEVESVSMGVWGSRDPAFSKQLCRQIRTACTGRS